MCNHSEIQILDTQNAECLRCPVTYGVSSRNGTSYLEMRVD